MSRKFRSIFVTALALGLFGGLKAYRIIHSRDTADRRATSARIEQEVQKSLGDMQLNLDLELPSLSEAGRRATESETPGSEAASETPDSDASPETPRKR